MATNRKLQAEIDRVLKRVSEGMEEFDQIWEKVHTASTPNLKEKYEADLKKEIKKLQRYRDQIKSWVSSSDVKNKSPLLEARKNIENEMERFKVLEKETKTKAYSKEGLSLVTKKKTDPRADPKYETISWIKKAVRDLKAQIETMQKASANKAKKGKPKTKGAPEPEESPINWIERHQWQIEQLSKTKRRLEKGEVTIQQVQEIKDDVGYYIESNQNPDFFEDEFLYNALDEAAAANGALDDDYEVDPDFGTDDEYSEDEDEEEIYEATPKQVAQTEDASHPVPTLIVPPASSSSSSATSVLTTKLGIKTPPPNSIIGSLNSTNSTNASTVTATTPTLAPITPTPAKPAVPAAATVPPAVTPATSAAVAAAKVTPTRVPAVRPVVPAPATSVPRPTNTPKVTPVPTPTQTGIAQPATTTTTTSTTTTAQTSAQAAVPRAPVVKSARTGSGPPSPTLAAATVHLPQSSTQPPAPYSHPPPPNQQQLQQQQQQLQQQLQLQLQQLQQQQSSTSQAPHSQTITTQTQSTTHSAPSQTPLLQPQSQLSSQSHPAHPLQTPQHPQSQTPNQPAAHSAQRQAEHPQHPPSNPQLQHSNSAPRHPQPPGGPGGPSQAQPLAQTSQAHSQPSPVPPQRTVVDEDYHYNLKMLEPSLRHTPDPRDSERPKQYAPRNPYRTPPYFPAVPAPVFDDPAIFEKFSTDTLFFIFYFQQGTPHQYLAARELKKQSWRYHKNFLTWFQRHDEPKLSTEEYEQGAYVYFDYESGWSTSIKTDFTFEYRHLEDELWVPTNASM